MSAIAHHLSPAPDFPQVDRTKRTSFFVTGLSISTSCVSRENFPSTSKSDSSVKLLDESTRFVRLGIEFGRVDWIEEIRLRASKRVRIRGESGKFPRIWISLSVKSIESCGYMETPFYQYTALQINERE